MALTTGSKVDWADISSMYNKLNTIRTKFSFNTVVVPNSKGEQVKTTDVSDLKTIMDGMKSNSYLAPISTESIVVPEKGSLLDISPFTNIQSILGIMENTCAHATCGSNYSGCAEHTCSYSPCSNLGYAPDSWNPGWLSGTYGWQTGNYGWQSGDYGWQSGGYSK